MIVTFANQKGGVGKSTVCLLLATYWSSQGLPIKVIDADKQRSLCNLRADELESFPLRRPSYEIEGMLIEDCVQRLMTRKDDGTHLLIDLPGSYEKASIAVLLHSDVIIVPFQYEDSVLDTTSKFGASLDMMVARHPEDKKEIIYVPNSVDFSVGRKEDKEYWEAWRKAIESVATLSPPLPHRVCFQRRGTIFLDQTLRECVTPTFEFITSIVFKNQLINENQDYA